MRLTRSSRTGRPPSRSRSSPRGCGRREPGAGLHRADGRLAGLGRRERGRRLPASKRRLRHPLDPRRGAHCPLSSSHVHLPVAEALRARGPCLQVGCGIYAARRPDAAASYLDGRSWADGLSVHRVIGTVSLWVVSWSARAAGVPRVPIRAGSTSRRGAALTGSGPSGRKRSPSG